MYVVCEIGVFITRIGVFIITIGVFVVTIGVFLLQNERDYVPLGLSLSRGLR